MPNHPSRNWRRVAYAAADQYITLLRLPAHGAVLTTEQLADMLRQAVVAGYDAGRKSRARPQETPA